MEYRKIIPCYLLSSFIPPIILVLSGLILESGDCRGCNALLVFGAFLVLLRLLFIHAVQFLGLFRFKNAILDTALLVFCSFSSSIIFVFYLLEDFIPNGSVMMDWELFWAPLFANFLLGFYTLSVLVKVRKRAGKKTE